MAFTETFLCDVCGKAKSEESEDWWLAWTESFLPTPEAAPLPLLKIIPWNMLLSHDSQARHLCGARCGQTLMDRWMSHSGD